MAAIQKSFFTTQHLCPDQRLEAWRESIGSVFDVTPSSANAGQKHHTTVSSYLINEQIIVSGCTTHAQRFERKPLKIARDGLDYYVIQTHLSGSQEIRRNHRSVSCHPGELMVIDLTEPHEAITTDFSQLTLVVPRHLLAPHLLHADSQAGRVLRADSALTMLAVGHLKSLSALMPAINEAEAGQLIAPTLLLIASALNGSAEQISDGGASISASQLARAKVEIENNLQRDLTVEKLGAILNFSRSTLYRLFEPIGGVRAYIQERRLRRSAEELLSKAGSAKRICDIAYAWGFASEAHFSRTFRLRFGMTPGEARALKLQIYPKNSGVRLAEIGDRDYEQWLAQNLRF